MRRFALFAKDFKITMDFAKVQMITFDHYFKICDNNKIANMIIVCNLGI